MLMNTGDPLRPWTDLASTRCVDMTAILGLHGFAAHHGDVANADYRNIPLITIVRSKQSRNKNLMTGTDTSLLE